MKTILYLNVFIVLISCGKVRQKSSIESEKKKSPTDSVHVRKDTSYTMECSYKDLSENFDIDVKIIRHPNLDETNDSCVVQVKIVDKKNQKLLDSLGLISLFYYNVFMDCLDTRSYVTGKDTSKPVANNLYGDIVVADLNFDNKEDIAIINDMGGNGGTFYNYYLQNNRGQFELDTYLTDSMTYFPTVINKRKKYLLTRVHAGACSVGEHLYKLDSKTNKWRQVYHKFIGDCE